MSSREGVDPDDLVRVEFDRVRGGYDEAEVDEFLDRLVAHLRAERSGTSSPDPVTAADVTDVVFSPARGIKRGYDPVSVDELLDRFSSSMSGRPSAGSATPSTPTMSSESTRTSSQETSSAVQERKKSSLGRLFSR